MRSTSALPRHGNAAARGTIAAFGSQVSMNFGAAVAEQLFSVIGAYGVTTLRIGLAAVLLMAWRRLWRRPVRLIAYGGTKA